MAEGQNSAITMAAYGTTIVDLPSQITYGGRQKICHAIQSWQLWRHHSTTMCQTKEGGTKCQCFQEIEHAVDVRY